MRFSNERSARGRSVLTTALGAVVLLGFAAGGPARGDEPFTIGVSVWDVSTTPFAVPLIKGMRDAAEEAGVALIVSDP